MIITIKQNIKEIVQILILTFVCNVTLASESKIEVYPQRKDIKGNPKSIEEILYKSVNLTDTVTKKDIHCIDLYEFTKKRYITVNVRYCECNFISKTTYSYNKNNNLINVNSYDSLKNVIWQRIYVYKKKGKLSQREDICSDRSCYEKEIYKYIDNATYVYFYDIDGKLKYYTSDSRLKNIKTQTSYSSDGEIWYKRQYEFDKKGKIIRYSIQNNESTIYRYDDKGNLIEEFFPNDFRKRTYKYDDRGYLSEHAWQSYDADYKVTYTYCVAGLLMEENHYKNEILYNRTIYKYDKKDNWIEKIEYESDNRMKITKRKIDYYK